MIKVLLGILIVLALIVIIAKIIFWRQNRPS